jgi:hypothetical protein
MTDRFRRALVMLWTPLLIVWHGVCWPFIQIWRRICSVGRLLKMAAMAVFHSPVSAYRAAIRWRDWTMAKVEYLQAESTRWRGLFSVLKSPYTFLRACGLSPSLAATMLFGATTVGGGVIVSETVFAERSFARGDSGNYSAPLDIPTSYSDSDNTLRIDLHGSTPVGEITISDVTLGTAFTGSTLPQGQTSVISVGGTAASSGFTATWLEVGHLTIDRWRCTTFELSDVETHTLNIIANSSDGQSISPIPGTPRRRAIGGGNRADSMLTSGGTYDQLVIAAPTSAINGKVDKLTLSNLYTKGGLCKVSRIKADRIDVMLSEFGAGNGFATKEFVVKNSVIYKEAVIEDNVEVSISPP